MLSQQQSHTPQAVEITPRKIEKDFSSVLATDYVKDNPFMTAYYNALSLSFPDGEQFFIDSVRYFQDQIQDPKLQKEIRAFCGQETFHSREHARFNKSLVAARGYRLGKFVKSEELAKKMRKKTSPLMALAITAALEHLTAILSASELEDPRWFEGMDESIKQMWYWHCIEEIEHKSVAYDVYLAVGGSYWMRVAAMVIAFFAYVVGTGKVMGELLKQTGQSNWSVYWKGLKQIFGYRAPGWSVMKEVLVFFKPGFHPWHSDSQPLLREWKQRMNFV